MGIKISNLNNNIEFSYKNNADTPRAALCMNFSINEAENIPGVHSLMSRLAMQGTTTYTAEELSEELDKYAIELIVELRHDYLRFKFVALNEDFQKAVEILADIVKNVTFDDFDKEREKMRGEIIAELDSSRTKVLKVISFVGDIPFEEVYSTVNEKLGDIENSKDEKIGLTSPSLEHKKENDIIKPDLNQAHIVQGWFVPTFESEDYPVLLLLNVILGASGLSSRLFLELRDKKGLAYVVRQRRNRQNKNNSCDRRRN